MGFGPPVVRVILRRLRTVKKSKATIAFAMVVKKCEPFLGCVAPMLRSRQIPCDGSFGQHKAELLQIHHGSSARPSRYSPGPSDESTREVRE